MEYLFQEFNRRYDLQTADSISEYLTKMLADNWTVNTLFQDDTILSILFQRVKV